MVSGPGRVELVDLDPREAGPGEVRVAIEGCGVCGSNLPVWQGRPWFDYPLPPGAPGHEGWGRVEAVGQDVDAVAVGQRVAFLGEQAFADVAVLPAADVVPFGFAGPFPGEALACAFNAVKRTDIRPGQTVAVVGIGFLGAVMVSRAVYAGARVVAISRRPFALEIAKAMGAEETVALDDDVVARVRDLTDGALCERVIEAVGLQEPLDLAGELTGEGGRLAIGGFHQDGRRSVDLQLWNWRGIDVVNAHERDRTVVLEGIRDAAAAIDRGELDTDPLYTRVEPLDRLDAVFDAMVERPEGFLKGLVRT